VPGLDPASVEATRTEPGQQFEVAFVQDTEHRRWVVRAPLSPAAGARMDVTVALLNLLARRLPFAVPAPKGFVALKEGGRVAVYPYLPGHPLDLRHLPAGPGLAAEIGRGLAALHNVDLRLFDEAGLPAYDADTYRTRRLAELDRAAATGHVPTGLLARWERALEDVTLWRFAPTPTHGDVSGEHLLAVFPDDEDAAAGTLKAVTGWENAKVADPADDFATLVGQASPEAFDSVMEAYANSRVERPDKHLEQRARLAHELRLVSGLLGATSAGDDRLVEQYVDRLGRLDDATSQEDAAAGPVAEPQRLRDRAAHAAMAAPADGVAFAAPSAPAAAVEPGVTAAWPRHGLAGTGAQGDVTAPEPRSEPGSTARCEPGSDPRSD